MILDVPEVRVTTPSRPSPVGRGIMNTSVAEKTLVTANVALTAVAKPAGKGQSNVVGVRPPMVEVGEEVEVSLCVKKKSQVLVMSECSKVCRAAGGQGQATPAAMATAAAASARTPPPPRTAPPLNTTGTTLLLKSATGVSMEPAGGERSGQKPEHRLEIRNSKRRAATPAVAHEQQQRHARALL